MDDVGLLLHILSEPNSHEPGGLRLKGDQVLDTGEGFRQEFQWDLHSAPNIP